MLYRPEVDGLRALAVLPVVFYHAGIPGFSGGFVGVDVFFVISGYLITSLLLSDLGKDNFSFYRFYERRARRILPALICVSFCCVPFAWKLMGTADFKNFSQSLVAVSFFSSNMLFWNESGYFDTSGELKPLLHTWSLGVEEQYYLFFPILLLLVWKYYKERLQLVIFFGVLASLVLAEITSKSYGAAAFYWLPMRGWELLAGSFLAQWERKSPLLGDIPCANLLSILGFVLIILSILLFDENTRHPSLITCIPVVGTLLILLFGRYEGLVNFILTQRIAVGLGLISYSFYLWHQPIFAFFRIFSLEKPSYWVYLMLIFASLITATTSYKLIEVPFRNKRLITASKFWFFISLSTSFLIVIGLVGHLTQGLPERFPVGYEKIFKVQYGIEKNLNGQNCHGTFPKEVCIQGDAVSNEVSWALVGDSHAGSFGRSFDGMLRSNGASGVQLTQGGCAYAIGLTKQGVNCLELNNLVRLKLMEKNIENIIVVGRYVRNLETDGFDNREGGKELDEEDSHFESVDKTTDLDRRKTVLESYRSSILELLNEGKRVILVYPIPEVGWNVPTRLMKLKVRGIESNITTKFRRYMERSAPVLEVFDNLGIHEKLDRVYPHQLFCDEDLDGRCYTELNGELLYFDDDHLSSFGAQLVMDEINSLNHQRSSINH